VLYLYGHSLTGSRKVYERNKEKEEMGRGMTIGMTIEKMLSNTGEMCEGDNERGVKNEDASDIIRRRISTEFYTSLM
jgi:hypothetical protein